jgi:acyl-CoA thioesterase-2
VEGVAEVVRSGTTSEVLRATLSQDGRAVVLATATRVADDMEGLQHRDHQAPQVPAPETLKPYEALTEDFATWPIYWRQVEGRPCRWPEEQSAGTPAWRTWLRLRGAGSQDRRFAAAQILLWSDLAPFNATMAGHVWPNRWIAPNIDLYVQFHDVDALGEWLLADAQSPLASGGLVAGTTRIWTEDGRLAATSGLQMMSRQNPAYAAQMAQYGAGDAETPSR